MHAATAVCHAQPRALLLICLVLVFCSLHNAAGLRVTTEPEVLYEEHLWTFAEDTSFQAHVNFIPESGVRINLKSFQENIETIFAVGDRCVDWKKCDMTFANRASSIIDRQPWCCPNRGLDDHSSCIRFGDTAAPPLCERVRVLLNRDELFDISADHEVRIASDVTTLFEPETLYGPASFFIHPSRGYVQVTYQPHGDDNALPLERHNKSLTRADGATVQASKLVDTGGIFSIRLRGEMWAFRNIENAHPDLQGELYSHINADYCCEGICYLASSPQDSPPDCNFTPQGHPLWTAYTGVHFFPGTVNVLPPYTVNVVIPSNEVPLYMPYGDSTPDYLVMIRFFSDTADTWTLSKSQLPLSDTAKGLTLFASKPFSECGTGVLEGWDPATGCTECHTAYGGPTCQLKCPGFEGRPSTDLVCGGPERSACPSSAVGCFGGCFYGRDVATPFCTCLSGFTGRACGERNAIQQAGRVTSSLSAFPIMFDIAVSGSFAAPVTTITQLQFVVMLGIQYCIPENIRALASGMTPVLNPLYGPLKSEHSPSDDADHLLHSLWFLGGAYALHLLVVSAAYVVKRGSGWSLRDCCDLLLFPNLSVLATLLLLANSVQSSAGVVTSPADHGPHTLALAYAMLLYYVILFPGYLWFFFKTKLNLAEGADPKCVRAAYLNKNVANSSENATKVVFSSERYRKMPKWLAYFLPWGFWTSQHLPDRKFCRRWHVLFGEYRGAQRDFMFANVLKFNAFALILGASKDTSESHCYLKMLVLSIVAAVYAVYLGRASPYSSRGSNILHLMVATCNVGTVLSILVDSLGWGTTHAHVFLLINLCVVILNYMWNILVIILGMTSYKVLHVCPSQEENTESLRAVYREAHFKRDDISDDDLREIMSREAANCDKFNICFPKSSGLQSLGVYHAVAYLLSRGPCACFRDPGQTMWVELRTKEAEAHLLYYQHSEDQEPLGGIDLTLCRVVNKEQQRQIQLVVMSTEEKIILCYGTGNDHKYWLQYIEQYTTHATGVQDDGPSMSQRPVSDYQVLGTLGCGSYGEVYHVSDPSGKEYAMKRVAPHNGIERQRIMTEVSVLQLLHHPFIVQLHEAMEEREKVFLILQLLRGGDLSVHLKEKGKLTVEQARFYCAQVALGLEHLHANSILYRDLKPSNIVLDKAERGNAVLTDMGVASHCTRLVSATLAGTPLYQAPEMLDGQPYSQAVDWWALGIVLFELIHGFPPFNAEQIADVAEMIRLRPVTTFSQDCSPEARALIVSLLQKKPKERLISPKRVKHHRFFKGIDWEALVAGELTPPYIVPLHSAAGLAEGGGSGGGGGDSSGGAASPRPLLRGSSSFGPRSTRGTGRSDDAVRRSYGGSDRSAGGVVRGHPLRSAAAAEMSDSNVSSPADSLRQQTTNPIESLFNASSPRSTMRSQGSDREDREDRDDHAHSGKFARGVSPAGVNVTLSLDELSLQSSTVSHNALHELRSAAQPGVATSSRPESMSFLVGGSPTQPPSALKTGRDGTGRTDGSASQSPTGSPVSEPTVSPKLNSSTRVLKRGKVKPVSDS